MGFSKAMRSAQLMLACYLFMASATSECGGDESCVAAEKDAAALLQSTVNIHGGPSGKVEENEDDSNSKQSLLSPRTSEASGCASKDKAGCTESSSCSWDGGEGKCMVACSTYDDEQDDCPKGYCFWTYQGKKCMDTATLNIGGESSKIAQQYGTAIAFRPEFATIERYKEPIKTWEPCAGERNCWHGSDNSNSVKYHDMRVDLKGSTYTKAAMDVQLTCDIIGTSSQIEINYKDLANGKVQVTYDGKLQHTTWKKDKKGKYEIAINSNDETPILRVEFLKENKKKRGQVELKIEVTNQPLWFEECMTSKNQHAQCLKVFATPPVPKGNLALRTDHQKQKECINGGGTSDDLCKKWYDCLKPDTRAMIVNVVDAFALTEVNLLQVRPTHDWKVSDGCTAGSHPTCQDPAGVDVEAFDCNCYSLLVGKKPAEIRALACPASESKVCCSWKTEHCPKPELLLQGGNEDTHSQKTMTSRSQQNNSENGDSLDDSLSGKRCGADA